MKFANFYITNFFSSKECVFFKGFIEHPLTTTTVILLTMKTRKEFSSIPIPAQTMWGNYLLWCIIPSRPSLTPPFPLSLLFLMCWYCYFQIEPFILYFFQNFHLGIYIYNKISSWYFGVNITKWIKSAISHLFLMKVEKWYTIIMNSGNHSTTRRNSLPYLYKLYISFIVFYYNVIFLYFLFYICIG